MHTLTTSLCQSVTLKIIISNLLPFPGLVFIQIKNHFIVQLLACCDLVDWDYLLIVNS
jgi:hypothetical protein